MNSVQHRVQQSRGFKLYRLRSDVLLHVMMFRVTAVCCHGRSKSRKNNSIKQCNGQFWPSLSSIVMRVHDTVVGSWCLHTVTKYVDDFIVKSTRCKNSHAILCKIIWFFYCFVFIVLYLLVCGYPVDFRVSRRVRRRRRRRQRHTCTPTFVIYYKSYKKKIKKK